MENAPKFIGKQLFQSQKDKADRLLAKLELLSHSKDSNRALLEQYKIFWKLISPTGIALSLAIINIIIHPKYSLAKLKNKN